MQSKQGLRNNDKSRDRINKYQQSQMLSFTKYIMSAAYTVNSSDEDGSLSA